MKKIKNIFKLLKDNELYFESILALALLIFLETLFWQIDFFDWLYSYTRAHEDWELDEYISLAMAAMLFGSIIAVRYIFIVRKVNKQLRKAKEFIKEQMVLKSQQDKLASMGKLAGGMAHEINNALQPALGLSEIAKNRLRGKDDELYQYMEIIENSALHAREIVQNVLSFSRNDTISFKKDAIENIFPETIGFASSISPKSITIISPEINELKTMNASIYYDKTSLQQVFLNLFKNSIDAIEQHGKITINVQKRALNQREIEQFGHRPNEYVILKISDNGRGIEQENLPKIFDPFFTTKSHEEGTGLGLSTIYGIIKQHKGEIYATSVLGKGTDFYLLFPAV